MEWKAPRELADANTELSKLLSIAEEKEWDSEKERQDQMGVIFGLLAQDYISEDRFTDAIVMSEASLRHLEEAQSWEKLPAAHNISFMSNEELGNYMKAKRHADLGAYIAKVLGDKEAQALLVQNYGRMAHVVGDILEAEHAYEHFRNHCEENGWVELELQIIGTCSDMAALRDDRDRLDYLQNRFIELDKGDG